MKNKTIAAIFTIFMFTALLSSPMVLAESKNPNNSAFNRSLSESSGNPDIVPGQFIVILKDDISADDIVKRYGVGQIHKYTNSFNGLAISASHGQISALASDPGVLYVENDTVVRASAQDIPPGIQRIGATQSITNSDNYADVTIAILDTGIDLDHDDLNVDLSLSKTFASGGPDANDKNGHGTHVAGTAAAINNGIGVVGVAQNAKLVAVKVLGNGGSGFTSDILAGIDYTTSLNEANPGTVDVINMSLGGSGSCGSYQAAIDAANAMNITTVVAAGNESDDAANHRPANCDNVITVSAIKDTDGLPGGLGGSGDDEFASFSNYGDKVEISAPGVSIYSTWKDNGYNTISGTSMASPHVAGAVAVIKHNNVSSMTFDQVLTQLTSNGIEQTSDLANENGVDCSTDPDSAHEKLVYLGTTLSLTGTCSANVNPNPNPETPSQATDAFVSYSVKQGKVQVQIELQDADGKSVPNTSVTMEFASNSATSGLLTKSTNDNGIASWLFRGVPGGSYTTTIYEVGGDPWTGTTHDPGFQK